MKTRIVMLMVLLFGALFTVGAVAAQSADSGYLRINNGSTISVARGERPNIVLQFGARGAGATDVAILCQVTENLVFTGAASDGPFTSFSVAPVAPVINKAISFPSALAFSPANFVDLPRGQNYNVSFQVNTSMGGGQVLCAMVSGETANPLTLNPGNVIAVAATTIRVR
jgi:hypothetical protein